MQNWSTTPDYGKILKQKGSTIIVWNSVKVKRSHLTGSYNNDH